MKALLSITSLSLALILPLQVAAQPSQNMQTLNLTEQQAQQLKQFREKRKLQLQQAKQAQLEVDRAALSEFLSSEQVDFILQNRQHKHAMKKAKRNPITKIIKQADQLQLTDNQLTQLQALAQQIGQQRADNVERRSLREQVKNELSVILTQEQIEKMQQRSKRLQYKN